MSIYDIIQEINLENGSNYKMNVLKKYKENEELKRVLKLTYDKVKYTFGISTKNINVNTHDASLDIKELKDALDILENDFATRKVTGNKAIKLLQSVFDKLSSENSSVLEKIVQRDLKINLGRTNINKIFKNLIILPIYMRCGTYNEKTAKKINFPAVVELKADGTYRELSITEGKIQFISRSGEEYSYPELEKAFQGSPDGYYHGEITVRSSEKILKRIIPHIEKEDLKNDTTIAKEILESSKSEEFILPRSTGNGLLNSDDVPHDDLVFELWDYVTPEDYYLASLKDKRNLPKIPYSERFKNLKQIINSVGSKNIRVIENKIVNSLKEALEFTSQKMKGGKEGAVLKDNNMIFKNGTSSQQLKLKIKMEVEVRCKGFTEGTRGTKREKTFGAMIFETDDGKIKGQCSGFSDKLLLEFNSKRDSLVGRIFTVSCNDITQGKGNDYHALSHVNFEEFRNDKDTTDTLERVLDIKKMAMELS